MSDSVQSHRWKPTRIPRPWDSPGKNTGVGCHFLLQCMKMKSEREVAQSCPTLSDPMTAAYQALLSMGFSRQEYWSRVPLPSPTNYILASQFLHLLFLVLKLSFPRVQKKNYSLTSFRFLLIWYHRREKFPNHLI